MKIVKNKNYYSDIFHSANIKYTPVRESIYKIIEKYKKPISSIDILEKLNQEYFLNKTTLYRNIEILKRAGLVDTSTYGHSHIHCELKKSNKKLDQIRYKLVCNHCETFEDIDLKLDTNKILKTINKNIKFSKKDKKRSIDFKNDLRMEVFYDCSKCSK